MNIYYTYHIIDPETNKIFYIGKGKGNRAYIHLIRAIKWQKTGVAHPGANLHLFNKLLKLYDNGLSPIYNFVLEQVSEIEALNREMEDIKKIGLENLCNLTHGGEGEVKTVETLQKISKAIHNFWESEDGYVMKQKFSQEKMGNKNPMWGYKEDENHKKERMKNFLATPRWNKGLKGDPRAKGPPKGNIPHNALSCKLINQDGRIVEANSLIELSKLSGVSISTISRLRKNIYKKNKNGWKLEMK